MARVLCLAGHDPSGGAGVDADREALERFGVEAVCVVTARTEQEGGRVRSITPVRCETWWREARRAAEEPLAALKTGLLCDAEQVRAVVRLLGDLEPLPVVVDPVLAASGGEPFLDEAGIEALLGELLPCAVVLTPNLREAARLGGFALDELQAVPAARVGAARALLERGAAAVLVKGGHGTEDPVVDLLLEPGGDPLYLTHRRVPGAGLHGSGCRFASALAAGLARGRPLPAAAAEAGAWLAERIAAASGRRA